MSAAPKVAHNDTAMRFADWPSSNPDVNLPDNPANSSPSLPPAVTIVITPAEEEHAPKTILVDGHSTTGNPANVARSTAVPEEQPVKQRQEEERVDAANGKAEGGLTNPRHPKRWMFWPFLASQKGKEVQAIDEVRQLDGNEMAPENPGHATRRLKGSSNKPAVHAGAGADGEPNSAKPKLPKLSREDRRIIKSTVALTAVLSSASHGTPGKAASPGTPTSKNSRPVPIISQKDLKRLKAQLVKPTQARKIVAKIKAESSAPVSPSGDSSTRSLHPRAKGVCFASASDAEPAVPSTPTADSITVRATSGLSLITLLPTPGSLAGLAANYSGAFDALAEVSGNAIRQSGAHSSQEGVPRDRPSIWLYWWGFEIALPPPTIAHLNTVHSISGTFLNFLQGLTIAGGAPELAPFIKYLSSYLDLEWKAIVGQDRGDGVVLAATWVLPVAIVPRPWDLASTKILAE